MPNKSKTPDTQKSSQDLIVEILEMQAVKNPELAAKQARLLRMLKDGLGIEPPAESKVPTTGKGESST